MESESPENQNNTQSHLETKIVSHYLAQKAGMANVDKKAIQAKVQAITKGTPKDMHNKQMEAKRDAQIQIMNQKVKQFSNQQRNQMKIQWKRKIQDLQNSRDLTKYWAHLDFDMFYIACQLLDRPELKDKPCAVGSKDGVLCTANYQARKYGVRSALPTFIAFKLCPDLHLIPTDFPKYKRYSEMFREILSQLDPNLQSHGLDQAYIEITDHVCSMNHQEIEKFILKLRTRIFEKTGLTVSCGVGANKMLAKLASEQKKPNDQYIIRQDSAQIRQFMKKKALRKIPGIGPVNEYFLKGLKIESVEQILQNTDVLSICFSQLSTNFYVSAAIGLGCNQHEFSQRKSVGKSQTFKVTSDQTFLQVKLKQLCSQISVELQELGFLTINAVFSYQNKNYEKKDKTINLIKYTTSQQDLFEACVKPFKNIKQQIRLLGVRCTSIIKQDQWKKMTLENFMNNKSKKMNQDSKQIQKTKDLMMVEAIGEQKGKMLCPICNLMIDCKGNLMMFNRHVDKCLKQEQVQINEKQQTKSVKKTKYQKQLTMSQCGKNQGKKKLKAKTQIIPNNNLLLSFLKKK